MTNLYYLQIDIDEIEGGILETIDEILGVKHNTSCWWQYVIEKKETMNYITFFLDLLEGKYDALNEVGISRDMIGIWHLYEYDDRCDLQYSPDEFKRMGDNEITLCVSCWNKEDTYF